MTTQIESLVTERFVWIADELISRFPDLDLQFTRTKGSQEFRLVAAAVSPRPVEIRLTSSDEDVDHEEAERVLYEAIFAVKEIAKLFDS